MKATCRCKVFKKEIECFLLGDSKVLDCSPATCHPTTKSPPSGNKNKRKSRHKKNSESNDSPSTVAAGDTGLPQGAADSEGVNTTGDKSGPSATFFKPVVFAIVAVAVLVTGLIANMGSERV